MIRTASLILLGCLTACSLLRPKPHAEPSPNGKMASTPATATSAGEESGQPNDPALTAIDPSPTLPYPEAKDTLSWEVGSDAVSAQDRSLGGLLIDTPPLPGNPQSKPQNPWPTSRTRPAGITQRPRLKDLPERIHVLLSRTPKAIALYSLGAIQVLTDNETEAKRVTSLGTLKGRIVVRRVSGGFSVEQSGQAPIFTTSRKLQFVSVNPYNLLDVAGSVYRGNLHLIAESDGEISTVNVLGVEDYLRGVLPYELGNVDREALEALKAQAIVARTYAYKRMMRQGSRNFHVYSDVQDQVYKGVRGEYHLSDRAVWETRGMAVTHADTLAICFYFSTCSGRTASKHDVWGGDSIPYLVSRSDDDVMGDPYCHASKYSSWTEEWSAPQLAGILRRNLRSAGAGDFPAFSALQGIEVSQRASCGRIRLLSLKTDKGNIVVKGDKVRWALRPNASENKILPSSSFIVKMEGGKIIAQGKGFGHGVGLCQFGAIARAKANQNFKQIIEAYYTDVAIVEYR